MKLIRSEEHSGALASFIATRRALAASAILRAEALRAARRLGPEYVGRARIVFESIRFLQVTDATLEIAGALDPPSLRALDAIHVATARSIVSDLDALVTYDERMIDAARELGLPVATPT